MYMITTDKLFCLQDVQRYHVEMAEHAVLQQMLTGFLVHAHLDILEMFATLLVCSVFIVHKQFILKVVFASIIMMCFP